MMHKARYFITQTETTRQGILSITGTAPENVKVVKNVLPSVFAKMEDAPLPTDGKWINIACVGNATPHKNFDIVPYVLDELSKMGITNVRFHITIPKETNVCGQIEASMKKLGLNEGIINHGRISQAEMADMYRHCQLCFLPT